MMNYCLKTAKTLIGNFDTMATLASPYLLSGIMPDRSIYLAKHAEISTSLRHALVNVSAEADNEYSARADESSQCVGKN